MTIRLLALVAYGLSGVVVPATAQSPQTEPPTLDLTCHGYDEGNTRAYNCIPLPEQQIEMITFVPEVGSLCTQGSIQEFPPGRIVFQIRCNDGIDVVPPRPDPTGPADYEIVNVRRYISSINESDWLLFAWRALRRSTEFSVTVQFDVVSEHAQQDVGAHPVGAAVVDRPYLQVDGLEQGPYRTTCQEWWFNPAEGTSEEEASIPAICGVDEQWSSVTIASADDRVCAGCGTFQRQRLPVGQLLAPSAADPAELDSFIEEITIQSQLGAIRGGW